jgi:hypothetical protein
LNNIVLRLSALLSGEKIGEHYASVDDRSDYPQHPIPGFRVGERIFRIFGVHSNTKPARYSGAVRTVRDHGNRCRFQTGSRREIDSTSHWGCRKPVHIPIGRAVPPERAGDRLDQIITWLDPIAMPIDEPH